MSARVVVPVAFLLVAGTSACGSNDTLPPPFDQTWTAAASPHVLDANMVVPLGGTLTIEPGAVVKLGEDVSLTIEGQLLAQGTSSSAITFTSDDRWGSLIPRGDHDRGDTAAGALITPPG